MEKWWTFKVKHPTLTKKWTTFWRSRNKIWETERKKNYFRNTLVLNNVGCFPHLFKPGDICMPWANTRKWHLLEMFEVQVLLLKLGSTIFLQLWQLCNLQRISCKSRKSSAAPLALALPPHCLPPAKCHGLDCWRLPDNHIRANTFTSQELWSATVWTMLIRLS